MMEAGVYMDHDEEELKDVKFPMETELCQGFKWYHDDKALNVQEAMFKIEEQWAEICGKSMDVCEPQGNYEKFKSSFAENGAVWAADDLSSGSENEDFVIPRLEADFRSIQDKLNLKDEQFNHLEEAYEKLRSEFQSSKFEWEKERLMALNKISSLQYSVDSQMRISDSLQTKLKMCKQALNHEENRRKLVEVQLSESQTLFENIYAKCVDEETKIDLLTAHKDEEIASLRYLLASNDILLKEREYKNLALKKKEEDMRVSLKEFQEAQIKHAASFQTLTNLQKKFDSLEQMHGSCVTNLKLKENEWTSQLDGLKAVAKRYLSDLNNKETEICDLLRELEMCQFSSQISEEEMNTVIMLQKSEYSEAYTKLLGEHENTQNQIVLLAKELEDSKTMLKELLRKQSYLEEYVLEVENATKATMAEKTQQQNFINAELQKSKSDAENMKSSLEEAQEILKQTETRLQLQLDNEQCFKQEVESLNNKLREEGMNREILQEQVTSLESELVVKDETLKVLKLKNKSYTRIIEELESENICLNGMISGLVTDWQNIICEMQGASNQLHEICCLDENLLAAFKNTEHASVENEHTLHKEIISPTSTKLHIVTDERMPFREVNYQLFKPVEE